MTRTCACFLLAFATAVLAPEPARGDGQLKFPIENVQIWAAGVPVRLLRVNLDDSRVRVSAQVAKGCPSNAEPFDTLIARSKPDVAINGTYFSKETLKPIGDIVVDGKLVTAGLMGTALAITPQNRALIKRVTKDHGEDWSKYQTVMGCGPALVLDGEIVVDPAAEGFHDPSIMGSVKRMGVGLLDDRHLLIVTTLEAVDFPKWAKVMKALGCKDAMNLDAGDSMAMYFRGKTIIPAGRKLTNLLTVHVAEAQPAEVILRASKPPEPPSPAMELLALVNEQRKIAGVPTLMFDSRIASAAEEHAKELAMRGELNHIDNKGRKPSDRIRAAGYQYSACAENLAFAGSGSTADSIIEIWINSTKHHDNMLNPQYLDGGIGMATSSDGTTYWVLDLARAAPGSRPPP